MGSSGLEQPCAVTAAVAATRVEMKTLRDENDRSISPPPSTFAASKAPARFALVDPRPHVKLESRSRIAGFGFYVARRNTAGVVRREHDFYVPWSLPDGGGPG